MAPVSYRFPLSFDWHSYRHKGGDGDGREERGRCFNLGLGHSHCNRSSIGGSVPDLLEAIRHDARLNFGIRPLMSHLGKLHRLIDRLVSCFQPARLTIRLRNYLARSRWRRTQGYTTRSKIAWSSISLVRPICPPLGFTQASFGLPFSNRMRRSL